jgi:hypothetical protein
MKPKFKAISIGLIVYIIGFLITGFLIILIVNPFIHQNILSPSKIEAQRITLLQNPYFITVVIAVGLLWLCVGGFIAGYLAKDHEIGNSFSVGLISVIICGILYVLQSSPIPIWIDLLILVLTIPAAMFGGFLSQRYSGIALVIESKIRESKLGLGIIIVFYFFQLYLTWKKIIFVGESNAFEIVQGGIIVLIILGLIYRLNIARICLLILTGVLIIAYCFSLISEISNADWIRAIFVSFLQLIFNLWVFVYLRKPSVKQLFNPILSKKGVSSDL